MRGLFSYGMPARSRLAVVNVSCNPSYYRLYEQNQNWN